MNRVFWLCVIALALAIAADRSHSEVTVLGGVAQFSQPDDGTYWNKNQDHDNTMTQPAFGVRWDKDWFAVQYTSFGSAKINALAVLTDWPNPGGYDPITASCHGPCAPLARWRMQSEAQSIAVIGVKHWGNWSLEAGINLYEIMTKGHVEYDGGGLFTYKTSRYVDIGPVVGLAYQRGAWSLRGQLWQMEGKGNPSDPYIPPSAFSPYQWTVLAGYSI